MHIRVYACLCVIFVCVGVYLHCPACQGYLHVCLSVIVFQCICVSGCHCAYVIVCVCVCHRVCASLGVTVHITVSVCHRVSGCHCGGVTVCVCVIVCM